MSTDLVDRLLGHKTLGAAPRDELAWVASRGHLRRLAAGDILTAQASGRVEGLFVLLSGHVVLHVDRGTGRRKVLEWRGGDVGGLLPYSRLVVPPGDTIAEEPTDILVVPRDALPAMIQECHELTSILVHVMVDRARLFTSSDLHDEKMLSLGKLAAGLAHELNNPASAVARSANLLGKRLGGAERASRALGAAKLTEAQLAAVDTIHEVCLATPAHSVRSPMEQADREAAFADWLEDHGADTSTAEPLAETAITLEALDRLAVALSGEALDSALRWVAAGCSVRGLAREIEAAAVRISDLVGAVKGFTQMDHATVAEPVDLGVGLAQTLAVLKAKARAKSASVVVELAPDLPRVRGFAGELNQVWANLIDNALDAIADSGHVHVTATHERGSAVVRVVDDGPGIPRDIRDLIFDPFFTTKPVGQGTGLGLDIARRLVRRHDGDIEVQSEPGRTEFCVRLPLAEANPQGGSA